MTATEVCQAAIQTQCDRVVVCDGALATTNCIGFANPCPEYYFNSASNRTVAGIAACLPALAARTCTDIALDLYPSCFVYGNLPAGSGCAYPSQCGSGNCGAGDVCATCRAGGVPVGGSCATAACVSGAFCHNGVCAAGSAVVHATQGQPCDLNGDPVTGCVGDLLCIPSVSGGTTGTCTPAPGAGQPCATMSPSASICAPGTICTAPASGVCQVVNGCGSGVVCDSASYCAGGDGGTHCAPRAKLGEACDAPETAVLPPCQAPAQCSGTPAMCTVPQRRGESCDAEHTCDSLLTCIGAICQPLGADSCSHGDAGTN